MGECLQRGVVRRLTVSVLEEKDFFTSVLLVLSLILRRDFVTLQILATAMSLPLPSFQVTLPPCQLPPPCQLTPPYQLPPPPPHPLTPAHMTVPANLMVTTLRETV